MKHIVLAQAAGASTSIINILLFASIFVVFYFFIIRPQSKRAKDQQSFLDNLETGERVITTGGIYGKVTNIEGDLIVLEVAAGTRIRVAKSSISMEMTKSLSQTKVVK